MTLAPPAQRRLIAALVLAGTTVSFNAMLGVPLIPVVGEMYGISPASAHWLLTVTLVVGAVATPVLGRLGDGAHRRRTLLAALTSATGGSVLAATAASFPQLLAGRALQGVGYAIVPLAVTMVREHADDRRGPPAIAALSVTVAIGASVGYPLSGAIMENLGFDAGFWFAAVVSGAACLAVAATAPRASWRRAPVGVDLLGGVLLACGSVALLLAVSNAAHWGWASRLVIGMSSLAVVLLAIWAAVELRRPHPLVDLRLMAHRAIVGVNLAGMVLGVGVFMSLTLVSSFAQTPTSSGYGFGASLTTAGLLIMPLAGGSLLAWRISRPLAAWMGSHNLLAAGAALFGGALLVLVLSDVSMVTMAVITAVFGLGCGCTFSVMPGVIVANVPHSRTGSAMGVNQVLRTLGGAIGTALAATILALHRPALMPFPDERGYKVAFLAAAGACFLSSALALVLRPREEMPALDGGDAVRLVDGEPTTGAGFAVAALESRGQL